MEHEAGSVPRYVPPNVRTEAHPVAWHTALAHHASPEELQNAGIVLLPLSRAARDGDVQRVKELLASGVPADEPGAEDGYCPLHWACCYGRSECVTSLIEVRERSCSRRLRCQAGATPDVRTSDGMTPIALAAGKGFPDCLQVCIEAGGDPASVDDRGWTPLHRAAWNCHVSCLQLLLRRYKVPHDAVTRQGWRALHQAARFGSVASIAELVAAGAAVDAPCEGKSYAGWGALHLAAQNGHTAAVEALLSAGADPWRKGDGAKTAADCARRFDSPQHTETLLILENAMMAVAAAAGAAAAPASAAT